MLYVTGTGRTQRVRAVLVIGGDKFSFEAPVRGSVTISGLM